MAIVSLITKYSATDGKREFATVSILSLLVSGTVSES